MTSTTHRPTTTTPPASVWPTLLAAVAMVWTTSASASLPPATTTAATPTAKVSTPATPTAVPKVVVFEPGILGYKSLAALGDYWGVVPERLRALGFVVVERAPGPVESPSTRALGLAADVATVLRETGADRVVIIAHSQGGLDVRAALDEVPGFAGMVGAVATLSSPHHGSPMADVGFALPQPLVHKVLDGLHWTFEANQGLTSRPSAVEPCLTALSPHGASAFNVLHPSSPVPFFSVGAVTGKDIDGICTTGVWAPPVVEDAAGPASLWNRAAIKIMVGDVSNDGVVPTASMRFGTFLGCVPADHGDWMGWVSHPLEEELVWSATPFLVELAHALVDVDRYGDRAMTAHLPALALLARSASSAQLTLPLQIAARHTFD